jgi:hypothetical protein
MSGEFQVYVSRNAIISKLGRMKIEHVGVQVTARKRAKREPKPKMVTIKPVKPALFEVPIEIIDDIEVPAMIDGVASAGVDYLANPSWGCKALLDRRGSDGLFMMCGQRRCVTQRQGVEVDSAYCEEHHRLFHKPREEQRRRYG